MAKNIYTKAVKQNLEFMETNISNWKALPIVDMKTITNEKGKDVSLPMFDYNLIKDYKHHKTLYPCGSGDGACCELCGHPVKFLFPIMNDTTKTTLNVGSSCVGKFQELTGNQMVKLKEIQISEDKANNYLKTLYHFAMWLDNMYNKESDLWCTEDGRANSRMNHYLKELGFIGPNFSHILKRDRFKTLRKKENWIKGWSKKLDILMSRYEAKYSVSFNENGIVC